MIGVVSIIAVLALIIALGRSFAEVIHSDLLVHPDVIRPAGTLIFDLGVSVPGLGGSGSGLACGGRPTLILVRTTNIQHRRNSRR